MHKDSKAFILVPVLIFLVLCALSLATLMTQVLLGLQSSQRNQLLKTIKYELAYESQAQISNLKTCVKNSADCHLFQRNAGLVFESNQSMPLKSISKSLFGDFEVFLISKGGCSNNLDLIDDALKLEVVVGITGFEDTGNFSNMKKVVGICMSLAEKAPERI